MRIQRITAVLLLLILAVSSPAVADTSQVEQLLAVAIEQLGTPYELFSNAPESFNCLTFVTYCFNQVADGTFQQEVFKPASLCNTSGYDTDLGTRVPQRLAVETVCRPDIGDMDWRYQPRSPQRQLLSIYIILHHNSIQRSKDK